MIHRRVLPLFFVLGLAASGCRSWSEDYWSFPVSRAVYESGYDGPREVEEERRGVSGTTDELWLVPLLLLLPIVIDLAILPITLVHDVFFVD